MDVRKHEGLRDEALDLKIESALDREIDAAVSVEPSPEFSARIRTRVAAEQVSRGWNWLPSASPGHRRSSWSWAGGAAAVMAAVALLWLTSQPRPAGDQGVISSAPLRPPAALAPAAVAAAGPPAGAMESPVSAPVARVVVGIGRAPETEPEVVISRDEAVALRELVAAINEGRVEPSVLPDLDSPSDPLEPLEELVVEPIALSPLVRLDTIDGVEGVRQ